MASDVKLRIVVDGAAQASAGVQDVANSVERLSTKLQQMGHGAVSLYGLRAAMEAVGQASKALVEAQVRAESLSRALSFSSARPAAEEMGYLRAMTNSMGLSFASTASAFAKFSAAARGTALEGQGTRTVFESIAKASTVMGLSTEETGGVLLALQQMLSKGAVSAEELRGQLGERLPGAFQIAARSMGVTTQELGKMLEQGQILSEEFLPKFAAQLNKELGDAASSAGDRTAASVNRLGNAWELLKQQVAGTGVSSFITGQLNILTDGLDDVRRSMASAARDGGGFAAQMVAGSAAVARFINPLNAFSYSAQDLGAQLRQAESELAALRKGLQEAPGRPLMEKAVRDTEALIDRLREAKRARDQLESGGGGGSGSVRSGDTALASAQNADFARRQKSAADLWEKYASPNEKFAKAAREAALQLGDLFTPELRDRMRDSFIKPSNDAEQAAKNFMKSLGDQVVSLRENEIELVAGKEAALAWRAAQLGVGDAARKAIEQIGALRRAEDWRKADEAASKDWVRRIDEQIEQEKQLALAKAKATDQASDMVAAIQQETKTLGMSNTEREISNALLKLEQAGIVKNSEEWAFYAEQVRAAIVDRETVRKSVEASKAIAEEWKHLTDQIGQGLTDSLYRAFEAGRGFFQTLWNGIANTFKTTALRLVINTVTSPMNLAIGSALGGSSGLAQAGQGASVLGNLGGAGSVLGSLGALGGGAGIGLANTLSGVSLASSLSASGSLMAGGSIASGLGVGIGAIAPYAAAAVAAYYIGKKLFGRKLADTGVEGTFSASGDFSGDAYSFYKGGLLRKDKTRRSALDPALEATLDAGTLAATETVKAYAKVLGLPVDAIAGYTQQMKLSLKGLSEEQISKAIDAAVKSFGEGLAGRFSGALQQFQKAGESMADTLQRLAGLQTFSNTLADLGGVFERVAGLSVDAREAFIGMAGGMDALSKNALQFVQDYYNRDEIAGIKAAEIKQALQAVGITQDVNSRDDFRALVDSINVSTEDGQKQLAALLDMASGFTQVADYLTETGRTLTGAAAQSPGGNAAALFSAGGAADQLVAINNVGYWTEAVYNAIKEQTAALTSGTAAAVSVATQPEVNQWAWQGSAASQI